MDGDCEADDFDGVPGDGAGGVRITYTPDGYYDCSPGEAKFIRWRVNRRSLPASAEAATYHRPDLVAAALAG